jgi:hypothetical protein
MFLLGFRVCLSATVPCSKTGVADSASRVDAARNVLLALPIGDGLQTDVSTDAQNAIASMKSRLNELFVAYMSCAPSEIQPGRIEQELSSTAHAFTLEGRSYGPNELPKEANNYGFQLQFRVKQLPANPQVIGISASFQIEYGMDSILGVFVREGDSWREVVRWTSKPYKTVSGAFWSFDYAISPPDNRGSWYLVTKFINPWCSSTWSGINYAVLRPNPVSLTPKTLLSASDFMWWGSDDFGSLEVQADKFDLRFHSSSIDGGVHNRVFIRDFRVLGDKVRRIPPVAVSPRDFVDEWIVSPWKSASAWSLVAQRNELLKAHRGMRKDPFEEFDSVRKCDGAGNHFQVAVSINEKQKYFLVAAAGANFQMESVTHSPNSRCGGPDLLGSMATK